MPFGKILFLDVDGVLMETTKGGNFWKEGAGGFLRWSRANFDLVFILSAWQGTIHDKLRELNIKLPSLAWDKSKVEGLEPFIHQGFKCVWVEDGFIAEESDYATRIGIKCLAVLPGDTIEHIQNMIVERVFLQR